MKIIYIHKGDTPYLDVVLKHTKRFNKGNIILIGDCETKKYADGNNIQFYNIDDYWEDFDYKHISVNSYDYEKFCFQRWIILSNFLKRKGIEEHIIYSDSDNVILKNVNDIELFKNYDVLHLSNNEYCCPNLFISIPDFIHLIKDYIIDYYKNDCSGNCVCINGYKHFSDMYILKDIIELNEDCLRCLNLYNGGADLGAVFTIAYNDINDWDNVGKYFNIHFNCDNKKYINSFKLFNEKKQTPLCEIMGRCGSDKGNTDIVNSWHNYTTYYYFIFKDMEIERIRIFELGLGTNNINIPSNMGVNGVPCASVYGWAEFFKNGCIFGADIDKSILITTNRIKTYWCDQTNPQSIKELWAEAELSEGFDIIIEDGLHHFDANVCFFENSIHKLKVGGWYIIEDIHYNNEPLFINKIKEWDAVYPYLSFQLIKIPSTKNNLDNMLLSVKRLKE